MSAATRVGVVIATKGRPQLAALVIDELTRQTTPPNAVVVVVSDIADAPQDGGGNVTIVRARPG